MAFVKPKKYFWIVLIVLLLILLTSFIFLQSNTDTETINLPLGAKVLKPQGWQIIKRPNINEIIFTNKTNKATCYLDIFTVRPDREYTFQQWLGTALTNQVFLAVGRETTYKNIPIFMGIYKFFDQNVNDIAQNRRAILKNKGIIMDIKLSYLDDYACSRDFDSILNSVTF